MTIKWNYNVGQIGKTTQLSLFKDENEGLGYPNKKTSQERKSMAEDETPSYNRGKIVDVDAWINIGGKGVFVKIEGKEYITSIESVKALLNGEKQGVKLGLLKKD